MIAAPYQRIGGAILAALLWAPAAPAEEPAEPGLVVDGISVLSGAHTANESDATLLLLSDIEFECVIIFASRVGPAGLNQTPTREDWIRARRRATLIRLLAGQARNLHETVDSDIEKAVLEQIEYDVGGKEALSGLLARLGMPRSALEKWIEDAALAIQQIRFTKEQVELPSRREVEAKALGDRGRLPNSPAAREQYRRLILEEKTDAQVELWLEELSKRGHIRIVR